ncbi:TPA: hypothetical protein N0G72_002881 [Pseudomonas aeruginosa]|nr:hypothetical protein [Pseudomonas aeruginosa]
MTNANECTCPSGDGSLRHPCPAHPAVEKSGGDERAAFELFVRKHCGMPEHIAVNWDAKFTNDAWEGWKARAALAKPSPAQAEAERPEVVAWQYRVTAGPQTGWSLWHPGKGEEFERSYTVERRPLMTVAQYERITAQLHDALDECDGDRWKLRSERDAALAEVKRNKLTIAAMNEAHAKLAADLEAVQARVAELEKQEPAGAPMPDEIHQMAFEEGQPAEDGDGYLFSAEEFDLFVQRLLDSCAAPVAQAQHSVPEGYALIPVRETDAMHDAVMALLYKGVARTDTQKLLDAYIAAAPGKEGNDD